ncbi:MAG: efflux RND transporter periplasmic adaptor subunit [Patescibacteria group bacterium]|nr:efflux RND transporter periplasmic adaptor subunit [Patescibacteria group bacterium]
MKKFFKKKSVIITLSVIVVLIIGGYFWNKSKEEPEYDFIVVEKGDLTQEVSVTGQVKPAESVDLAFERSGKVGTVVVKIGDIVTSGQLLASLINGELASDLLQKQANLEAEQAKLDEIKAGTRPEEIQQARTDVSNAEIALSDKEDNLENVRAQAIADLESDYSAALTSAESAATYGKSALLTLADIQQVHFNGSDSNSLDVADAKEVAVYSLLGESSAGRSDAEQISFYSGGAYGTAQNAVISPTHENIDLALTEIADALQDVKIALNAVPIIDDFTSTQETNISTAKTNVNSQITAVSSKRQAIAVQKATNASSVAIAEASVNTTRNTLANKQDTLTLKLAGYTPEQIAAQEAKVKSARASVGNIQAQINKTIIRAPINGVITKQDAKVGEIITANIEMISIISEAEFEIETNIPEADIAKIKVDNNAMVTLDAYGDEEIFNARVITVDPAETIIEGVSTYKVTLQFIGENGRIRSGMTANIDITTAKLKNVISVPQRAVIYSGGEKVVRVLNDDETISEVVVKTGVRGLNGRIEIIEGVEEGDRVITTLREK